MDKNCHFFVWQYKYSLLENKFSMQKLLACPSFLVLRLHTSAISCSLHPGAAILSLKVPGSCFYRLNKTISTLNLHVDKREVVVMRSLFNSVTDSTYLPLALDTWMRHTNWALAIIA